VDNLWEAWQPPALRLHARTHSTPAAGRENPRWLRRAHPIPCVTGCRFPRQAPLWRGRWNWCGLWPGELEGLPGLKPRNLDHPGRSDADGDAPEAQAVQRPDLLPRVTVALVPEANRPWWERGELPRECPVFAIRGHGEGGFGGSGHYPSQTLLLLLYGLLMRFIRHRSLPASPGRVSTGILPGFRHLRSDRLRPPVATLRGITRRRLMPLRSLWQVVYFLRVYKKNKSPLKPQNSVWNAIHLTTQVGGITPPLRCCRAYQGENRLYDMRRQKSPFLQDFEQLRRARRTLPTHFRPPARAVSVSAIH
jgi:hypothetical protein